MKRGFKDVLTLPLFRGVVEPEAPTARQPAIHRPPSRDSDEAETVDLETIAAQARELMAELGLRLRGQTLQATGWRFKFDHARTRLGCCTYAPGRRGKAERKVISISKPFAVAYGWKVMEDVVRHEVAHAMDVDERSRTDHGDVWKAWAVRCGADPTRLYEGENIRLPAKYVAVCPVCRDRSPYYRKPRRPGACAACCKRHNGGLYDPRFRLTFYTAEEAPAEQLVLFQG